MQKFLYWLWRWFSWTLLITCTGATLGVLLYLSTAPLWFPEKSVLQCLQKGIQNGGFYFFVWAPGGSIVICFIEAWGAKLATTRQPESQTPETP